MSKADKYDIAIIGAGLGGLLCGAILSREGLRVCIVEKNEQIGGSLQTFRRDGVQLDTGIHYIGSFDKGQTLYRLFDYLGVMQRLELTRMDVDGFDMICFGGDEVMYPHGMGYDNFIARLADKFPEEKTAIEHYCEAIQKTCDAFPLYSLSHEEQYDDVHLLSQSAKEAIESFSKNKKLQAILAGANLLYAGDPHKTPWYVHALISNSFIESSWRCTRGGDQIAKLLAREIKANGGVILTKHHVTAIKDENGIASHIELEGGDRISADKFISNVHPAVTLKMCESSGIRPAYRSRIEGLDNSISAFVLNIILKPDTVRYTNRNYYYFDDSNVWNGVSYTPESWPFTYGIFEAVPSHSSQYLESLSVMAYMRWSEVAQWTDTHNTSSHEASRGEAYELFKKEKTQKLLDKVAERFPDIVRNIQSCYATTPLTYRDYLATPDGSIYGIAKDCGEPLKTMISAQTRIPNLYLTGQNVKLHGVLGVALTALVTCSAIVGREHLLNKIR
jgi:all-trans-retinol 13,14-reductase